MAKPSKSKGFESVFKSNEQKQLIETAAQIQGLTFTAFVRSSALKAAREAIKEGQLLLLSDQDWGILCNTLEEIPEPNKALKDLLNT